MNVLFITLSTIENVNDQNIYTDLMKEFSKRGENVYIVTPRQRRLKKPTEYVKSDTIQMLKVKIGNITKINLIEKGLTTATIDHLYLRAIKKYYSDVTFDLIIYTTPPITFEKVIRYVKKRDGAKSYLLLKDIFPQNAVDLGMLKTDGIKSFIYKYFKNKEKKLYNISDYIGCMSKANVDFIIKHNPEISRDIVEICPNSITPISIDIDSKLILEIKNKYNIPLNKTIFIYGGNLGKPQGIPFLIECLNENRGNTEVHFVIAGSGTEFNVLDNYINNSNIKNAQLFSQIPKDDYELLVNCCDVGLLFLDNRFTIPNFPSRVLSYMQSSMPVLAATDINTDIGQVIEVGEFGYWCESGNIDCFNKKLKSLLSEDLRKRFGKNGRKYLETHYTVEHSYQVIMKHFTS